MGVGGLAYEVLQFVVEDEDEGSASASEYVGEGSFEEGSTAFLRGDRLPAVDRALVDDLGLLAARLHHHTPTYGVEGVRHDTG